MKPWLWLSPQLAHKISPVALNLLGILQPDTLLEQNPFNWRGLTFTNRIGLAGGVDKNGVNLLDWQKLGAGFLELGTVTPLPQTANTGIIMDRNVAKLSLWNKMGFPNQGMESIAKRLVTKRPRIKVPLLINLGKNRDTPLEESSTDYIKCIRHFRGLADLYVINISSPNTKGLRSLQGPKELQKFLDEIFIAKKEVNCLTPILLKLSPDLDSMELKTILDTSAACGVDGWILTNTTNDLQFSGYRYDGGGLSGKPLAGKARLTLRETTSFLGSSRGDNLLISAGGIFSAEDVKERLDYGADLVEIYSSLVFEGPFQFRKLNSNHI